MIRNKSIREALVAVLQSSGLFETVIAFQAADLNAALETLRDSPDSVAIVVPSRNSWEHQMIVEEENIPVRAESRAEFEILVTLRELAHGGDGAAATVDLMDDLSARLLWSDLAVPGLRCLPQSAEPMVIEIDENRGREAWKLTAEIRQSIFP